MDDRDLEQFAAECEDFYNAVYARIEKQPKFTLLERNQDRRICISTFDARGWERMVWKDPSETKDDLRERIYTYTQYPYVSPDLIEELIERWPNPHIVEVASLDTDGSEFQHGVREDV